MKRLQANEAASTITFRVNSSERDALKKIIDSTGMANISEAIRYAIAQAARDCRKAA